MSASPKIVKVLHFSSHKEADCGVAKYQNQYVGAMQGMTNVVNTFFEVSPYDTRPMSYDELTPVLDKLQKELENYDVFHIQHEFGLYWHDQFSRLVEIAKQAGKKVIITVHLSPDYAIKPVKLGGIGPRSFVTHLRKRRHYNRMVAYHVEPMRQADVVIVHNSMTAACLERFGVDPEHIVTIAHPVYEWPTPPTSTEIATNLKTNKGDVVYAIVGFLHRHKGIIGAVRALKYLPPNYKLALLGGVKPDSDQADFADHIADLIDYLGVHDRVYITGFVADDNRLNALIRECDVCVYPYDKVYYANLSSGSINLAISNDSPVIAYPTAAIKELAAETGGAIITCESFSYYELARELKRIDLNKQTQLSHAYAQKNSWSKAAMRQVELYHRVVEK